MVDFAALAAKARAEKAADTQQPRKAEMSATEKLKAKLSGGSNAGNTENPATKPGVKFNFGKPEKPVGESAPDRTENSSLPSADTTTVEKPKEITAEAFTHPEQPDKYTPEEAEKFSNMLEILRNQFDHKELVAEAMKSILNDLAGNENLRGMLLPTDMGLMVRHLRENYGVMIQKAGTRTERATKVNQLASEIADDLGDLF